MNGGVDWSRYEELEEQWRAAEDAAVLQDIQRKHLFGQLSREEALLARHSVLQAKKANRALIDKEVLNLHIIYSCTKLFVLFNGSNYQWSEYIF